MSRPRIRTVKPELWQDEAFGTLSKDARLLFIGLITMADDEGRLRAMPAAIIGHVFPYDDVPVRKLRHWMEDLVKAGLIVVYSDSGLPYAWLPGWAKHQRINRPTPSRLPSPPPHGGLSVGSLNDHGNLTEASVPHTRTRVGADRIGSGTTPPIPPRGERTRDQRAFEEQVRAYAETLPLDTTHPDAWHQVRGAISNGARTTDAVLDFVREWRPELLLEGATA